MIKTILLSCSIALLLSFTATAQKGTWMIYGNGGYDNVNYTANNINNYGAYSASPLSIIGWSLNTGVGCMLNEHFMIGLQGGYGQQEQTLSYYYPFNPVYIGSEKERVRSWQAGVFCRYTTLLGKRFFVYSQLFAGKYGVNTEAEPDNYNQQITPPYYPVIVNDLPDGNGFIVNLFPAVGMNVLKGYGINVSIGGVSYTTYNSTSSSSDLHHFNVTLGQQFNFGLHKILNWKKFNATPPPPPVTN